MFRLAQFLLKPVIKPFVRLILGLLVIPLFRLFLHRVLRKELDEELEKDISQWLKGSILLLVATSTMEATFFFWVPPEKDWLKLAMRLLLAVGVIENMPDQALFSIIHPGPPPFAFRLGHLFEDLRAQFWPQLRGIFNQYLSRSSAVFAILSVVLDPRPLMGPEVEQTLFQPAIIVWVCYGIAITNYLIIGLVCSRDKALNVLSRFDKAVSDQRHQIEFDLQNSDQTSPEAPSE